MLSKLILVAAAAMLLAAGEASAAEYEMINHADILFAEHDGTKLVGDLYLPKGRSKAPVLVAVHGGGWQVGNKQFYRNWGLFLARAGYAVLNWSPASATSDARWAPAESPMSPMRSGSRSYSEALARMNCTAAFTS